MRIEGELLKLGIGVSATTIATVLRRGGLGPARGRVGASWSDVLRAQAYGLLGGAPPSSVGAGLEDDASVRTGPAPDGEARQVEADADLSLGAADEPRLVSHPLAPPRPLSAAAEVRSLGDRRTECRRRSHRSHARDGPPTGGWRSPATNGSGIREAVAASRQRSARTSAASSRSARLLTHTSRRNGSTTPASRPARPQRPAAALACTAV